jgi:hypothetical protein
MNWKSFILGFLTGIALLSGISHWKVRPRNVIASWPDDDNKKGMQMMMPWVTEARVGNLGPFVIMVPKSFTDSPEALLQPAKGKNPWIHVTEKEATIYDSKKRAISVDFNASTGEFRSYTYFPKLASGLSFTDREMTGVLEKVDLSVKKK